jgi:hypothetical protein
MCYRSTWIHFRTTAFEKTHQKYVGFSQSFQLHFACWWLIQMLRSCLANFVALNTSNVMTDCGFKWSCIVGSVVLNGSKDRTAFAFKVKLFKLLFFNCLTLKIKNTNIHWNVRKYPLTQLRFPEDYLQQHRCVNPWPRSDQTVYLQTLSNKRN